MEDPKTDSLLHVEFASAHVPHLCLFVIHLSQLFLKAQL